MNSLDTVLLAVIAISSVWGAWRGMFRSVYGLAAFVAAFWVAKTYAPPVFLHLIANIAGSPFGLVAAYVLVFFATLIPLMVLSLLLRAMMRKLDLGSLDRAAGFVFGFLRGALLAFIGAVMVSFVPFIDKAMLDTSAFLPAAGSTLKVALNWQPLREYRRFWRFEENGAPVLDANALVAESILSDHLPDDIDLQNLPEGVNLPEITNQTGGDG